ncbi:MAG: hypothetical protein EOM54_04825 [Clostridia bacterium]|nr:hypothetical protein [Clostridia bacterium]
MRRRFLFSLLLLTAVVVLSACSQNPVPAATESPPAVTDSPTPEPTPEPTPVELSDYLPPTDFEVADVWRVSTFVEHGSALLYTSAEADGAFSFKMYMYQYLPVQNLNFDRLALSVVSGAAEYNGEKYSFSLDQGIDSVGIGGIESLSGTMTVTDDSLVIEYLDGSCNYDDTELVCEAEFPRVVYSYDGYVVDNVSSTSLIIPPKDAVLMLPAAFKHIPDYQAGTVMYHMPLFADEISLPFPRSDTLETLEIIMGPPVETVANDSPPYWTTNTYEASELHLIGIDKYWITSFDSADPEHIPAARGVEIGDDIRKVISSFLCVYGDDEEILASLDEYGQAALYGNLQTGVSFCRIEFEDGRPTRLWYVPGGEWVVYTFDEDGCVESVRWAEAW